MQRSSLFKAQDPTKQKRHDSHLGPTDYTCRLILDDVMMPNRKRLYWAPW